MRFALGGERMLRNNALVAGHSSFLGVRDVLEFATIVGAQACGLDHRIGSLSPGKDADLICIRRSDLNLTPVSDAIGAVVLAAHPGNVDTVIVRGKIVKQGGRMVDLDVGALRTKAEASRDRLFAAAGRDLRP
jgi:cytosine/adenosine deaminase-related metal-dependent hydrolase